METVHLLPRAERRCRSGHLWVFSNELRRPLPLLNPGDDVVVVDARGHLLGSGTFHPRSLIAVRLHALGARVALDRELLDRRIRSARELREQVLGPADARTCRVVNADGDLLPGLVVDRYEDVLVVQCLTAATDSRTPAILEVLEDLFRPVGILLRNDAAARDLEGLERRIDVAAGTVPSHAAVPLGPLRMEVDLRGGHKTGFYFDQRFNYPLIRPLCPGKKVLDAFCFTGAWALHAAHWGAAEVTAVDRSATALEGARGNARENGLEAIAFQRADVLSFLKTLPAGAGAFDVIVLDPPPFTRTRKQIEEAFKGHLNLHKWALRCLRPGGFLLTCCCSSYLDPDRFLESIRLAAGPAGCRLRLVASGGQGPDHPWIPAMPETAYLKVHLLQCLRDPEPDPVR